MKMLWKKEKGEQTTETVPYYDSFPRIFQYLSFGIILFSFSILELGCRPQVSPQPETPVKTSRIPYLTDDNFLTETRSGIVLLDFTASWCEPCKMMEPHLEKVFEKLGDQIKIAKIDVDQSPVAAKYFGIRAMPTLFVLVDGKTVRFKLGAQEEEQILDLVEDLIRDRADASAPPEPSP